MSPTRKQYAGILNVTDLQKINAWLVKADLKSKMRKPVHSAKLSKTWSHKYKYHKKHNKQPQIQSEYHKRITHKKSKKLQRHYGLQHTALKKHLHKYSSVSKRKNLARTTISEKHKNAIKF